jgi:hypothetical protein
MKLHEMVGVALSTLKNLKDNTDDRHNGTPGILESLSKFTDGALGDLISELETIEEKAEELEEENEKLKETVEELEAWDEK